MLCYLPIPGIEAHVFSFQPQIEDTRMYLLRCAEDVLCVDPSESDEAEAILKIWGTLDLTILLTHEHYDHISGVNWLRTKYRCNVICTEMCATLIQDPRRNLSQYMAVQYAMLPTDIRAMGLERSSPFSCEADTTFNGIMTIRCGGHVLTLREMRGHSKGSMCICLDDKVVFTGDNLIPHKPVVTNLPGGSMQEYLENARAYLWSLHEDMWVLPGHFDGGNLGQLRKAADIPSIK